MSGGSTTSAFTTFRLGVVGCVLVAGVGLAFPDALERAASEGTGTVFRAIDWFYMATVTGFLLLALWLAFSPFGQRKLGKDDEQPEFSTVSWLAMLFSAGMGAGLLFWGVAEPMSHYTHPPLGDAATPSAARQAMVLANFHWGLHAWAIYCMAAMVLAYFRFRHGCAYLPGAPIRKSFRGRWVQPLSFAADVIAVLAVAFGVAGAMGLGVMQIHSGLSTVVGLDPDSRAISIAILLVVFVSYMASAATSLDKGIKWLSNINMVLAFVLLLFVLFSGPTALLLRTFVTAIGDYLSGIVSISFRLYPFEGLGDWLQSWTLTYLIWWIAWAPFVGVFVARISRGRTIREFVFGVLLAPTAFTLLWFAVLGGTAFFQEADGPGGIGRLVSEDVTAALFAVFEALPGSALLTALAVFLIFVFMVTSVDSATYVLSMLTSDGATDPPRRRKLVWGVSLALLGGTLLFASNVSAVRAIAISGAIPFTFVLLIQVGAFLRQLVLDSRKS